MKKYFTLTIIIFSFLAYAQQHPIAPESPVILESGYADFEFGAAHFFNQSFPLSGLKGDLTKIGTLFFRIALSDYVEVQAEGTLLDLLNIKEQKPAFNSTIITTKNPTGDIGDFTLWTKIGFLTEQSSNLGLALRFGVQLPNASNESGLGVDEMNFFSFLLFQKYFGGIWTVNVGLGILGDPTRLNSQHDVFIYGLEYSLPIFMATSVAIQTAGRTGHEGIAFRRLANSKIGVENKFDNFSVKTYGIINFSPTDNAKGFEIVLSFPFQAIRTR